MQPVYMVDRDVPYCDLSQSPYGEASLATGLQRRGETVGALGRNPLTGKHLLQLMINGMATVKDLRVAIPLRGSISCNEGD